MKNNFTQAFIAVFILSCFTLSCKKNSLDSLYVKNNSVNFSVADATTWFKDHLPLEANSAIGKSCKIKTLLPSGSNAIIGEDDKYYAVEFPVELERPLGFTVSNTISPADKINGSSRLLILKSKKNGYIRSVLMHIFSSDQKPDLTISYSKISKSFNGNIFYTDLYGNFINGYVYENGKIIKKTKLQRSSLLTVPPRDPIIEQCINSGVDWYQRSCDVYADGSMVCGAWEYIGTVPTVTCNDIPSGGEGGPGEDECITDEKNNFNQEASGAYATSQTLSFSNSTINTFQKHKDPIWTCLNGYGPWKLNSQEIGIVKLVDPNINSWEWVSLTHGGITMEGSPLPGTSLSFTQGVGTPTISKKISGMSLNFTVTYTFVCDCPNLPGIGWVPPIHKSYTSTALWNSNPL
ncbi:MAG: hypothetical protein ABI683_03305 [Ginsengibacter sp.]